METGLIISTSATIQTTTSISLVTSSAAAFMD